LRAAGIGLISDGVTTIADIAAFITARRDAYEHLPNRELAAGRLAADLTRLRIEHGDRVITEAVRIALGPEPRPQPMTASGVAGKSHQRV